MGFKDLPPDERLRILRSDGGFQGWLREQAKARAGAGQSDAAASGASSLASDADGLVACTCRVPPEAEGLLRAVAGALAKRDGAALEQAAQALRQWSSNGAAGER